MTTIVSGTGGVTQVSQQSKTIRTTSGSLDLSPPIQTNDEPKVKWMRRDETIDANIGVKPEVLWRILAEQLSRGKVEISGFGWINPDTRVIDFVVVSSQGQSAFVATPPSETHWAMNQCYDAVKNGINMQWHTHPGFGAFFSGTDTDDIAKDIDGAVDTSESGDMYYIVIDHVSSWIVRRVIWDKDDGIRFNDGTLWMADHAMYKDGKRPTVPDGYDQPTKIVKMSSYQHGTPYMGSWKVNNNDTLPEAFAVYRRIKHSVAMSDATCLTNISGLGAIEILMLIGLLDGGPVAKIVQRAAEKEDMSIKYTYRLKDGVEAAYASLLAANKDAGAMGAIKLANTFSYAALSRTIQHIVTLDSDHYTDKELRDVLVEEVDGIHFAGLALYLDDLMKEESKAGLNLLYNEVEDAMSFFASWAHRNSISRFINWDRISPMPPRPGKYHDMVHAAFELDMTWTKDIGAYVEELDLGPIELLFIYNYLKTRNSTYGSVVTADVFLQTCRNTFVDSSDQYDPDVLADYMLGSLSGDDTYSENDKTSAVIEVFRFINGSTNINEFLATITYMKDDENKEKYADALMLYYSLMPGKLLGSAFISCYASDDPTEVDEIDDTVYALGIDETVQQYISEKFGLAIGPWYAVTTVTEDADEGLEVYDGS